ncbi:hypothetical protein V8C34DRAFT_316811 [Trichoderma compactum]
MIDRLSLVDKDSFVGIQAGFLSLLLQFVDASIEKTEYLPFNSTIYVNEPPRYLFRVSTPYSQGTTDTHWVKSMAASDSLACGEADILSTKKKQHAADMLNRHLRWRKCPHDNLVSWTSSLLFALVYIFHIRASIHNEVTLDQIQLLVVDTTGLPKGAFMRDLDLMCAFRSVDPSLRNVEDLRHRQSSKFQATITLESHCQMVSARNIIDRGSYDIRKEFKEFASWKRGPGSARWANAAIEMREVFYRKKSQRREMSKRAVLAALRISHQFGLDFQAPIAANLIAIAAPRYRDMLTQTIRGELPSFTDFDRKHFIEESARIAACDTMPELQEYSAIMQGIYKN